MRSWLVVLTLAGAALAATSSMAKECTNPSAWAEWAAFQTQLITPDGRVVDESDERRITTSEGQSYALFFALVNNDRLLFRRLLRWTENNLAGGDLTARLPAWLWGRGAQGAWQVIDANTASDANLWIAYTLLEAGRLWREHSYSVLGTLLLQRMAEEEIMPVPGLGPFLVPGRRGFEHEGSWRLNPSYLPMQLLQRARQALPGSVWEQVLGGAPDFLVGTSPLGLAPDWVRKVHEGEFAYDEDPVGSYDAIRVYLWAGMLHPQAWSAPLLKSHFSKALDLIQKDGLPAEKLWVLDGRASGVGPVGFSAALLPLFSDTAFAERQRARIANAAWPDLGYYNQVLILFGKGWDEQRFAFDAQGQVIPAWTLCN